MTAIILVYHSSYAEVDVKKKKKNLWGRERRGRKQKKKKQVIFLRITK